MKNRPDPYRYQIERGSCEFHKEMEKQERNFYSPYFQFSDKPNEDQSLTVKSSRETQFEVSNSEVMEQILKVHSNIRNHDKRHHCYYSTSTRTALIISALSSQALLKSGLEADKAIYDEVRMVAKNARCIYFVGCEITGLVKIGIAKDLHHRLASLQVGSPTRLTILGAVVFHPELEKLLHKYFEASHSHGEWFRPTAQLENMIKKLESERALYYILDEIEYSFNEAQK